MEHDTRARPTLPMSRRTFLAATGAALLTPMPLSGAVDGPAGSFAAPLVRVGYLREGRCVSPAHLAADPDFLRRDAAMALRGPFPDLLHPTWRRADSFTVSLEYPHVPGVSVLAMNYQNGPAVNFSCVHRQVVPNVVDRPLTLVVEKREGERIERQRLEWGCGALPLAGGTWVLAMLPAPGWSEFPPWDAALGRFVAPPPHCLLVHVEYARALGPEVDQA
ncbi:hypothetical protein HS125_09705 [bacterium]|nr:hypothetical protein [bacterium]